MPRQFCARSAGALLFAAALLAGAVAHAGPGHDHGPEPAAAAAVASSPRVTATSEAFELVGLLKGGRLTIYLDRMDDTSPVTDARLDVAIDGESSLAEPQPDGTYSVKSAALAKDGDHEIVVTITAGSASDLLVGTLKGVQSALSHGDRFGHDHADHHPEAVSGVIASARRWPLVKLAGWLEHPLALAGIALVIGGLAWRLARMRAKSSGVLVVLLAVVLAGNAEAGPGHDHGHEGPTAGGNGDAPRRLPDGSLFLPKPTQRLLDIRTRLLAPEMARGTQSLIGRVIADPNHSGQVQSTIGGRVRAPNGGLPVLGQRVKAGDVLALVEPAFTPIDSSDVRQTAGDLEQKMAVIRAKVARQRQLVEKQVSSRASLEDLEIELSGLEARRAQLSKSRSEPEALLAPIDGVVAETRVAAGQVVSSTDVLFQIVDPKRLWVEAIAFDQDLSAETALAQARTADGTLLALSFVGRSRALQQQATILQFRITAPPDSLNIATPVKVLIETGRTASGLIIPKNAVAQAPNGQMVVLKRLEPERYQPTAVRFEDIDGERVHVIGGLAPGDRIIVRNAPLVNQIR